MKYTKALSKQICEEQQSNQDFLGFSEEHRHKIQ